MKDPDLNIRLIPNYICTWLWQFIRFQCTLNSKGKRQIFLLSLYCLFECFFHFRHFTSHQGFFSSRFLRFSSLNTIFSVHLLVNFFRDHQIHAEKLLSLVEMTIVSKGLLYALSLLGFYLQTALAKRFCSIWNNHDFFSKLRVMLYKLSQFSCDVIRMSWL